MPKLKEIIRVLLTPTCWVQVDEYSAVWDAKLNVLMRTHRFTHIGEYTAEIDGITVWIANHPYASFHPYGHGPKVRPRRATILAAHDKLLNDIYIPE